MVRRQIIRDLAIAAGMAAAAPALADTAPADPIAAIAAGRPILEARPRYEGVDQAGFANDADALTLRLRLGWETAAWRGLKGLIEVENVTRIGSYHFNDQVTPNPAYPVVADPDVTEINRLQLTWAPGPSFSATVGRQRINLDDQRFVGGVAWRQDEQTYDAVTATGRVGPLQLHAGYIWQVNRVFAEAQDWDGDSWISGAAWPVNDAFRPQAFLYALQFDNAAAQSTITYGVRVTGRLRSGPLTFAYGATWARQEDWRNNPASFDLGFWQADVAGTWRIATLRFDYQALEGNGARGFATPLATLHAFQGWADVFLTTPVNGVEDANLSLTLRPTWRLGPLRDFELTVRGHDFRAERTDADLGSEIDAQISVRFTRNLTGLVKYADYDGVPGFANRRKLWIGLEFRL